MDRYLDFESFCMGTNIVQRIYGEGSEYVGGLVIQEMRIIEQLMSFYNPQSEINRINAASGIGEVHVSKETLEVIRKSIEYSVLSNGLFDITIGCLTKLWGIFGKNEKIPSKLKIDEVLELINYKDIVINDKTDSIKLNRKGQMLDLGGIAKGYAADRAIEIYRENGIKSAFINIGGNVLTLGNKPDGSSWNIGIQDPAKPRGQYIGVISVNDKAIVTSGDYVRYFVENGIRYHHILNPLTGYPSNSDLTSTTIITQKSIDADGLSTPVFTLGLTEGMEQISRIKDAEGIFITKDKKVFVTEGAAGVFAFCGESSGYDYRERRKR